MLFLFKVNEVYSMSIRFVFLQLLSCLLLFVILLQERHAYLSIKQCSDFISCLTEMSQTKTLFSLPCSALCFWIEYLGKVLCRKRTSGSLGV